MADGEGRFGNSGDMTLPFGQPNYDRAIGWYTDTVDVFAVYHGKAYRISGGGLFNPDYWVTHETVSAATTGRKPLAYADLPWWFQADRLGEHGWKDKLHRAIALGVDSDGRVKR